MLDLGLVDMHNGIGDIQNFPLFANIGIQQKKHVSKLGTIKYTTTNNPIPHLTLVKIKNPYLNLLNAYLKKWNILTMTEIHECLFFLGYQPQLLFLL